MTELITAFLIEAKYVVVINFSIASLGTLKDPTTSFMIGRVGIHKTSYANS
jgi:hypothetical protein